MQPRDLGRCEKIVEDFYKSLVTNPIRKKGTRQNATSSVWIGTILQSESVGQAVPPQDEANSFSLCVESGQS